VIAVVAVLAVVGILFESVRSADEGSMAVPSDGFDSSDESTADESYILDGVTVELQEGWTFLLTSNRDCPAGRVDVGFSDSENSDSVEYLSEVVTLQAGVPYPFTIPDDASDFHYASIDDIACDAREPVAGHLRK
jgi:hypothetical protein